MEKEKANYRILIKTRMQPVKVLPEEVRKVLFPNNPPPTWKELKARKNKPKTHDTKDK